MGYFFFYVEATPHNQAPQSGNYLQGVEKTACREELPK